MPYIPSRKTDMNDREIIDAIVKKIARYAAVKITNNFSLIWVYGDIFIDLARSLRDLSMNIKPLAGTEDIKNLAQTIYDIDKKYDYEGAFLGELNYAVTQFIQLVPNYKYEGVIWEQEFRYWIYACTIDALTRTSRKSEDFGIGISGVFEDVKDEYKRRVNVAYEAGQILKNGDCYFTPYYTRLVEVVDEYGNLIGHQEIMMKRSVDTIDHSLLGFQIVVKKKTPID